MKIGKTLKKISAVILVFAMSLGLFNISGIDVKADSSYSPVKMYYCDTILSWRGFVQYTVYIQIDSNSAANKAVYVHHTNGTDGWSDTPATYVAHIDNNTEIWKATITSTTAGDEYAIKYVGDGQTYWDNNDGNNYTYLDVLGAANIIVNRLPYQDYPSHYKIQAILRNLGYTKVVKVKYTQDNWATFQEAELHYSSVYSEEKNLELWEVTLNLDKDKMDSFQYCVSYEVNGNTYWDNNFGANYNKNYYIPSV